MSGQMPVDSSITKNYQKFQKAVEQKSGGTLKFTYYPAGSLAMDMKAFEMVQAGGLQMAEFTMNRAAGVIPAAYLDNIPDFSSIDSYIRLMFDPKSGGGAYSNLVKPGFEKQGIYLLPGIEQSNSMSNLTKKPISTMAEYKGLKLRVAGEAYGWAVDSWGATPTIISAAETYTALQRGLVDGVNTDVISFVSRKFYEVGNNVQLLYEGNTTQYTLVNLAWWKSLSVEQQNIIKESLREQVIASYDEALSTVTDGITFLKKNGATVINFKEEKNAEWVKMRDAAMKALEKNLQPKIGTTWDEFSRMHNATKDGTPAWRDILKTMQY